MSIEVLLFVVMGLVAVGAAVGMLITPNAVHSALFLILNFACVAFLFLLLDAPFLALVQVAVYAGAIMVLFLFVIMLLGAEQTLHEVRQFKWLAPITLTLAVSFLIAVSLAFLDGEIDEQPVPMSEPMLRVINASPAFESADVYLNGELFASDLGFGGMEDDEPIWFDEVAAGEYQLAMTPAGDIDAPQRPIGSFEIAEGEALSVVVFGGGETGIVPRLTTVQEDISFYTESGGRFLVVNALDGRTVRLMDAGTDRILEPTEVPNAEVIIDSLALGEVATVGLTRDRGTGYVFVEIPEDPNADANDVISRPQVDDTIQSGASNLWVLTADSDADQGIRPIVLALATETLPQFGSPEAIGNTLFVEYMLPFEMVALLLLAAMVGAIVLTQRSDIKPKPGRPIRRKVSRPLTSVISSQTGHSIETDETAIEPAGEQPEPAGD
jgi:NADH-quinone oxidoreductase subunit J